jgi:hypothetical protein
VKELIAIDIKTITRGALAIALICVYFTVFKGVTNIFNALLVPLTLYLSTVNQTKKGMFTIYGVLILFCFLFFKVQFIFTLFYCGIAFLLTLLQKKHVSTPLSALILTVTISTSFWISIVLTDYFFLTHMGDIMLKVFHGNYIVFLAVLLFEGALVGISQLFLAKLFYKRLINIIK